MGSSSSTKAPGHPATRAGIALEHRPHGHTPALRELREVGILRPPACLLTLHGCRGALCASRGVSNRAPPCAFFRESVRVFYPPCRSHTAQEVIDCAYELAAEQSSRDPPAGIPASVLAARRAEGGSIVTEVASRRPTTSQGSELRQSGSQCPAAPCGCQASAATWIQTSATTRRRLARGGP